MVECEWGDKMGTMYIFRGKAATGKTTLSNMLAKKLSIPVLRKDDIIDALKSCTSFDTHDVVNKICYNILYEMVQSNLDLRANFILDIALGDRNNATTFFKRLDFKNNTVIKFFVDCSDEDIWKNRHIERLKHPLAHQTFQSIEHLLDHYGKADIAPFDDEYRIDSVHSIDECFCEVLSLIKQASKK